MSFIFHIKKPAHKGLTPGTDLAKRMMTLDWDQGPVEWEQCFTFDKASFLTSPFVGVEPLVVSKKV